MPAPYTYVVERWNEEKRDWFPQRFDVSDLEEMGEVIDLLQEVFPEGEFRPAQYTVSEFQYIKSFG